MSRTRIVKGTYTKITGGDYNMYVGGNTNITALGKNNFKGDNYTIYGNNPQQPPIVTIEETRVKTIVCLDDLDEGSANDGNKRSKQKGVIYGKSYKFEVTEFTDGEPITEKSIRWKITCVDPETGDIYDNILKEEFYTGRSISINFNASKYCGCKIIIKAFMQNAEAEGKIEIFYHNRFRWFDRKIIKEDIKNRTDDKQPWLINQNATSLCGMASIFFLFAKENPEEYKNFALQLHRTGEATYNEYIVTPDENIYNKRPFNDSGKVSDDYVFFDTKGTNEDYMPLIDYITLASIRNTDNGMYKGGNEQIAAINWPWFMIDLCKKFLGYKEVDSKGINNPIKPLSYTPQDFLLRIKEINNLLLQGYKLILMIDSDLISDDWDISSLDLHWVVLETPIQEVQYLDEKGKVNYEYKFKVFSWGSKAYPVKNISWSHFINNYNGYIKVK